MNKEQTLGMSKSKEALGFEEGGKKDAATSQIQLTDSDQLIKPKKTGLDDKKSGESQVQTPKGSDELRKQEKAGLGDLEHTDSINDEFQMRFKNLESDLPADRVSPQLSNQLLKLGKPDLDDKRHMNIILGELKILTKDLEKELQNQIGGKLKDKLNQ